MDSGKDKDAPSMEKAHAHVASGEEYEAQGLLVCAFPEFYKAAEMFQACVEQTMNAQTKQTLRLLANENNRRGKEIQRKIAQNREQAANFPNSRTQSPHRNIIAPTPRYGSPSYLNGRETSLAMSQRTIDDSYMVLGGKVDPQDDPFNVFWNKLEKMLDNLSQPVAFATIPLTASADGPKEAPAGPKAPISVSGNNTLGLHINGSHVEQESIEDQLSRAMEDDDELLSEWGMDESFYVIPSATPPPSEQRLHSENEVLKQELEAAKAKLLATEKILKNRVEQERALRDSIISVRREAQRAISASTLGSRAGTAGALDATLPAIFSQAAGIMTQQPTNLLGPERETQYVRRIRELEDELRLSRVENEKNKATIQRFRERWEKLKESAKRKRSARAAEGTGGGGVKETIQEEPELEDNAS